VIAFPDLSFRQVDMTSPEVTVAAGFFGMLDDEGGGLVRPLSVKLHNGTMRGLEDSIHIHI